MMEQGLPPALRGASTKPPFPQGHRAGEAGCRLELPIRQMSFIRDRDFLRQAQWQGRNRTWTPPLLPLLPPLPSYLARF